MQESNTHNPALIDLDVMSLITADQAWHFQVIPFREASESISFYTYEGNEEVKEGLEMLLNKAVQIELIDYQAIQSLLQEHYKRVRAAKISKTYSAQSSDDFLDELIAEAKKLGSSDIHIEVYEDTARVRIRIDGELAERYLLHKSEYPALTNKIKIKAHLDIAEKRLPQDGRIHFNYFGESFDIRVSVLPTLHGEKLVLRLLNNDATHVHLDSLGMNEKERASYREGIKLPSGIILISGPTGSGKTTTLYATLKELNKVNRNIITIEDPIEYTLEGVNQVQLKESIGLTFGSALRSFLRQDPDVIMLGEIRDKDTAEMAIRAALTGHLVLSTIHTNSAWGTISRLIDMGVPPFLLSSTLNLSVAQRLVRKLCEQCKKEVAFDKKDFPRTISEELAPFNYYEADGCDACFHSGYKGRQAIYEIIPIDRSLSNCIKENRLDMTAILNEKGIDQLADNAIELLKNGTTSAEEIYPILANLKN
ncbi:MAG: GspE/PulE family protein [Bacteroidota bacterium]